jgi:hypothetical protein
MALYADKISAGMTFFSLKYLPEHISQTVYYFFNFTLDGSNNLLISILGLVGVLFMAVLAGSRRRAQLHAALPSFLALTFWTIAIYGVILSQFWSSPTDNVATRFSLPVQFLLAVAAAWFLGQIRWLKTKIVAVALTLVLWNCVVASPAMSRAAATYAMPPSRISAAFIEFASHRSRTRTLYICYSSSAMIAERYACQSIDRLNATPAQFIRAIKAGLYDEVIISQRIDVDTKTGIGVPYGGNALAAEITVEVLEERVVEFSHISRISRLTGFKKPDGTWVTPSSDDESIKLRIHFPNDADFSDYRRSLYP